MSVEIRQQATARVKRVIKTLVGEKEKHTLRAQLMKGATGSLVLRVSSTLLGFLSSIVLARLLGAEGFGTYAYAMALIGMLDVPAKLGFPQLIVRNVAAYRIKPEWNLMRGLLRRADQLVLLASVMIAVSTGMIAYVLSDSPNSPILVTLSVGLLLIPLNSLAALRENALRGLQYIVTSQVPQSIVRPTLFLLLLGFLTVVLKTSLNAFSVMVLQVVAAAFALLALTYFLSKSMPKAARQVGCNYQTLDWLRGALPFLIIVGTHVINTSTDIIMLGMLSDAETVGLYKVASRGGELISFPLVAVSMAIAPTISSLYTSNQLDKLQRLVTVSARWMLALALPIAGFMVFFNESFLVLFGREFVPASLTLSILSIGWLINVIGANGGLLLEMSAYARDTAWTLALAAAVNVLLNAILIPRLGSEGAALASVISVAIREFILIFRAQHRLGIHATALGRIGLIFAR